MKTLTEFSSFSLKTAVQTADQLATSGKTPEEMPAALGEALKLEGDKLNWMVAAIDVARSRGQGLKRILVMSLAEGEAAPAGAEAKEGFVLLPEFFPGPAAAQKKHADREEGRGGRGGRGGGKGGRGDKRGKGRGPRREGDSGPRREGDSGPRREAAAAPQAGSKPVVLPKPRPKAEAPAEGSQS